MGNFKSMLMSQLNEETTESDIRNMAEQIRLMPLFSQLSDFEYDGAIKDAISTISISHGESYVVKSDEKHVSWFQEYYKDLGVTRWDRYKDYLKNQNNFAPSVVTGIEENLFKLTDLLGDPNGDNFMRKGLVVGDVQSGKTANYVGLMNLAADAKYKVMIVLTGTTNTLREQTQIRIEEGLGKAKLNKGVAKINNIDYQEFANLHPVYLTSRESDFKISSRKNIQLSIENTTTPIVIITKKNATALKHIYEWLSEYSLKLNHDHIDSSLLLIDDEADFASVNVSDIAKEEQPTAINSKIRSILKLFTKSSYIGFTATPFANIFIDPQSDSEMLGQDLFPSDYIYVLGESDEYIGVQNVFGDDAKYEDMLIELTPSDVEDYLPLKHKKDDLFMTLPPSMIDAINLFFLANVVRDIRKKSTAHRSMLINVSRFTDMHERIKKVVLEYVNEVKKDIRLGSRLPFEEAVKKPTIASIYVSFINHYESLEEKFDFRELLEKMNESIYRIKVAVVNSKSKELDYLAMENEGERVIVIGGFALSRGLTLEGLMISYYYRNSVMYDSLLQMGRWFGYRPGYADLCRIYMTKEVISDFKFIAMATKELKEDLEANSIQGLTPREFGIKVRSGQTGLIITARNKMRAGQKLTTQVDYSKDVIETTALINSEEINQKNRETITKFVETHKQYRSDLLDPRPNKKCKGLTGVNKLDIITFLKDYIAVVGSKFDSELITNWLRINTSPLIDEWDIVFPTGELQEQFDYGNGLIGNVSNRSVIRTKENQDIYKNGNSRLASPGDGRYGLTSENFIRIKEKYQKEKKTISQKDYLASEFSHKPVIIIYSVMPKDEEGNHFTDDYVPMLSIGIPELRRGTSQYVNYTVNKIYQELGLVEEETE